MRPLFWLVAGIATILAMIPGSSVPSPFPHSDKLEHFATFALLGGLAWFGFPAAPGRLIIERLALLGAGIEVFQSLPFVDRRVDVLDWAADVSGAGLAVLILAQLAPRLARAPG